MMMLLDHLIPGSNGAESFGPKDELYTPQYEYLNMGDVYNATLVYNRESDTVRIAVAGDIMERLPNEE
jgi:hypothetical protein